MTFSATLPTLPFHLHSALEWDVQGPGMRQPQVLLQLVYVGARSKMELLFLLQDDYT